MSRNNILLIAPALLLAGAPQIASAQAAGWKTEIVGKDAVLTPPDLGAGEFYQITIHPRVPMNGALITDFVDQFAAREVAALGKPVGKAEPPTGATHDVAVIVRGFVTPQGAGRVAGFTALSADGESARVIEVVSSPDVTPRYQPQFNAVLKEMWKQERAAALASGRGLPSENLPTPPQGMTPGGPVVPGIYAGGATFGGEFQESLRLYLYASGEYQMCDAGGREVRDGAGEYRYDPITGLMDVGHKFALNNNKSRPDDGFCLYGRGADGKPFLHARETYVFKSRETILRYVGPPDRPSPRQQKAAQEAAEAEAARYKYVVAPGKGLRPAQIAGVFHHLSIKVVGMNPAAEDESYLLLRDGTVHDGLPVPPDELDVPLSRRREPQKWGRWRRQGASVLVAWPDNPGHFAALDGSMAVPGTPGERLSGRFGTGETSGSLTFGGSYRLWGVTFTPEGRFLKDERGGASTGTLAGTLNDFSSDTTYDDNGSTSSVSSTVVAGGVTRKKPGGHRGGTYSVSGYVLTLRYDDGRVARLPFFFQNGKRDQIYFEGATLALGDGK